MPHASGTTHEEALRRVRDDLATLRSRWQTNADLGRLSTYTGCAADLDDVLATVELSLRAPHAKVGGTR